MGGTIDGKGYREYAQDDSTYQDLDGLLDQIADLATDAWLRHLIKDSIDDGATPEEARVLTEGHDYREVWRNRVHSLFAPFRDMPTPSGFDWELTEVVHSADQVDVYGSGGTPGGGQGKGSSSASGLNKTLEVLGGRTEDLTGKTAETFYEEYVAGLPGWFVNLHLGTVGQACTLAAEQQLWTRARLDVVQIARATQQAMFSASPEQDDSGLEVALIVVGAVASAAAAVVTAGGSLAVQGVVLGLAGIGASVAKDLLTGDEAKTDPLPALGADTPWGVLENVATALDQLRDRIVKEERKVEDVADSLLTAISEDVNFDLASPALLRDDCASHVLDDTQLKIRRSTIDKITDRWLADVADAIDASSTTRSEPSEGHWNRGGGLGLGPSGCFAWYAAIDATLKARAADTSRELRASAQHLRIAATAIGRSDEEANGRLTAHTRRLGLVPLRH